MEDELLINVKEYLGTDYPQGRTSEDGSPSAETLRLHILENLKKYRKITISLESIVKMTRTFVDEAFAKILEECTLEEFNEKIFFPDAKEPQVQELNQAFKLRLKIIATQRERNKDELGL